MFGNWLNPNLDYDDIANYALWVVVMVAAQAAQVLELIVKGNSARWRLEKLITDIADVCGRPNSEVKEAMTTQASRKADSRTTRHGKQVHIPSSLLFTFSCVYIEPYFVSCFTDLMRGFAF